MSEQAEARLQRFWDDDAETYDRSPTHAGTDPVEAAVWRSILLRHIPEPGASILDAGAGTGAISLLLAGLGYRVTALDLSHGMLALAEQKAARLGMRIDTIVGPATQPPPGPFDAVVERHMLWTAPDPVAALRAWREVAPVLVSYEGIFGQGDALTRARRLAAAAVRRALAIPREHHAEYDPDLLASLPLARGMGPGPLLQAVGRAGWRRARIERLGDVEWARRLASPNPVLGWLETVPHFALLAEA
jgi:SAM-dependent methyltransferase